MKIAAIKGKMGIWTYYASAMKFSDVARYVSPITKEISNNDTFSNMLQRAITNNVDGIKEYLLSQRERFFNALVLAIYDGKPEWNELEVDVEDYRTYSVGILELNGEETIFPVDGQHRVEGIRKAILEKPELKNEKVPVIFIGHQNTDEGKQRTRRLFSTLNRRARKVSDNELIALDEDDVVAIATREIIENNPLFLGKRLINSSSKNVPSSNHEAFTSILELYQCNKILFNHITAMEGMKGKDKEKLLLYRPDNATIKKYEDSINEFWVTMSEEIPILKTYITTEIEMLAELGNRNEEGGNYLFRPIALTQYIYALCDYIKIEKCDIRTAIVALNKVPTKIQKKPWLDILWTRDNKINGRIRGNEVKNMFLYYADKNILKDEDIDRILDYCRSSYANPDFSLADLDELSDE